MAESFVEVTTGSGLKLHSNSRTVGGSTVHDELVLMGEPYLATYSISGGGIGTATANSHVLQIMAGSTLPVYIRRIEVAQDGIPASATQARFQILRLTTAGTSGTGFTPVPLDSTDAASGCAAMFLPTSKGTEGARLAEIVMGMTAAQPLNELNKVVLYEFSATRNAKAIRIPAGTSNGVCVKLIGAIASATILITAECVEASF